MRSDFSLKTCSLSSICDLFVRVCINRVIILLVVSRAGKMNIPLSLFVPENLVSRDGFGGLVPREPAHLHTQAKESRNARA